ncbi:MAG: hypothetical protein RL095_2153 [Verrucomicrobiota bacterium]|jgi:hypothetical protein
MNKILDDATVALMRRAQAKAAYEACPVFRSVLSTCLGGNLDLCDVVEEWLRRPISRCMLWHDGLGKTLLVDAIVNAAEGCGIFTDLNDKSALTDPKKIVVRHTDKGVAWIRPGFFEVTKTLPVRFIRPASIDRHLPSKLFLEKAGIRAYLFEEPIPYPDRKSGEG